MKNEKTWIGILACTALAMLTALLVHTPRPAQAGFSIKDRDYIIVTADAERGGDALWITDIRTSRTVVFVYDPATRSVVPRAVRDTATFFER